MHGNGWVIFMIIPIHCHVPFSTFKIFFTQPKRTMMEDIFYKEIYWNYNQDGNHEVFHNVIVEMWLAGHMFD